ncbi:serine/threonine-protein kinase [Saccharomonospora sp. NPDC046836]|uniref:serine/threonine-protein kinase n=1 Tax=Saccharomonospora sp. NPDC046836 TaxID=3156921 RepID=UPI00340624B7
MSRVGDLLADRYRLRRKLGSGSLGVVWKAIDQRLQRPVAIKQLSSQSDLDPAAAEEATQRVMDDGRNAAQLQHPNAVSVYDVELDNGVPLLVMEYFPARSLAAVLEDGPLTPDKAAEVGEQVAGALAAAHEAGIVHGDVKPANILIADDGTVKIGDFGIATAAGDTGSGTPGYLSPEVASGRQPAPSSDVFSLGATLYAAVEGTPPLGNNAEPRHAGELTPVLMAMLAEDATIRPTALQVHHAAQAVVAQQPALVAAGAATEVLPRVNDAGTVPVRPVAGSGATQFDMRHAPAPADASGPLRSRRWIYVAGAVLLAALVGLLLTQLTDSAEPSAPPTAETPGNGNSSGPLSAAQLEQVVSEYYGLLPGEPDRAWERLGPALQEQGAFRFRGNWAGVGNLTVLTAPRVTGDNTVQVEIELALRDGMTVVELHEFGIINANGSALINSDTVLRRDRRSPPPPTTTAPTEAGEPTATDGDATTAEQPTTEVENPRRGHRGHDRDDHPGKGPGDEQD